MQTQNVSTFEKSLACALLSVHDDGTENRISVADVRQWAFDYVREHKLEIQRFPDLLGEPHWTLFAIEHDCESLFVILTFDDQSFSIHVGRGDASEVRDFGENIDSDIDTAIKNSRTRFSMVPSDIALPISAGYHWIETN